MLEDAQMDLIQSALTWFEQGHRVAIATVTSSRGSSPRPVGSQLVVRDDGHFLGSVSGGCVEGAVISAAVNVIESGVSTELHYGAAEDDLLGVGLACGGQIDVLVTALQPEPLQELQQAWQGKVPCCAVIAAETGHWKIAHGGHGGGPEVDECISDGSARWSNVNSGRVFLRPYVRPIRVVVVGAVHIAQALSQVVQVLGMQAVIVDPRQAFASAERFPQAQMITRWPEEALDELELDARTAVVALTHDPKVDDPALARALRSDAFYIGALGSRKSHANRLCRLREQGFSELQLSRIHGPVGLPIGAKSPAEIAVSVISELTARLRLGISYRHSAVILAAGQSSRAGEQNKLLHKIDGIPMIQRVVNNVCHSRIDDVVVVTGHDAEGVRAALSTCRVRFVHNSEYAQGMSTSIRVGIDAVADADAACIVLGDMPWIDRADINALIQAFAPTRGRAICVPEHEGKPGNPVLWAREFFEELRRLTGDRGARALWQARPEQVAKVAMQGTSIHEDVDRPCAE